jgi:DNA-binding winged helix-turn-helix (wHTH) protein
MPKAEQVSVMKSFGSFRLDTPNHCLWSGEERVRIAPKAFDVLRYLVENPGRLVTQDEILEALWPETYVNPEILRKYILDIRKILGDRSDKPVFIETVTKRGYRFVAPVTDLGAVEASPERASDEAAEQDRSETAASEPPVPFGSRWVRKLAMLAGVALILIVVGVYFWPLRNRPNPHSLTNTSIAVLPFADMSPGKDQE